MKQKVDYKGAWEEFRRWMREEVCLASGYERERILAKMTEIRKQCTKREG